MARKVYVDLSNSIESWRLKTNLMSEYLGDLDNLTTDNTTDIVGAVNSIEAKALSADAAKQLLSVTTSGSATFSTLSYNSTTGVFSYVVRDLNVNDIPNLDAGKITSGVFAAAQIPSIPASRINAGTLDANRIPNLDASKITTGVLNANQIPTLDGSKIASGVIDLDRLPSIPTSKLAGFTETVDTDTTYSIKASAQSGGAGLDLDAGGDGSGTDIVFFLGSGSASVAQTNADTITISATDTNFYLDGMSFNTSSGELTATVNGSSNVTVNLDGRYLTTAPPTKYIQASQTLTDSVAVSASTQQVKTHTFTGLTPGTQYLLSIDASAIRTSNPGNTMAAEISLTYREAGSTTNNFRPDETYYILGLTSISSKRILTPSATSVTLTMSVENTAAAFDIYNIVFMVTEID